MKFFCLIIENISYIKTICCLSMWERVFGAKIRNIGTLNIFGVEFCVRHIRPLLCFALVFNVLFNANRLFSKVKTSISLPPTQRLNVFGMFVHHSFQCILDNTKHYNKTFQKWIILLHFTITKQQKRWCHLNPAKIMTLTLKSFNFLRKHFYNYFPLNCFTC